MLMIVRAAEVAHLDDEYADGGLTDEMLANRSF